MLLEGRKDQAVCMVCSLRCGGEGGEAGCWLLPRRRSKLDDESRPPNNRGIEIENKTYNAQMPVDCRNALVGALLEQLGCDNLLRRQHDAVLAADADRGAAVLNCLYGIFDLEVAAIGGENGVGKIVACSYGSLFVVKGDLVSFASF